MTSFSFFGLALFLVAIALVLFALFEEVEFFVLHERLGVAGGAGCLLDRLLDRFLVFTMDIDAVAHKHFFNNIQRLSMVVFAWAFSTLQIRGVGLLREISRGDEFAMEKSSGWGFLDDSLLMAARWTEKVLMRRSQVFCCQ